ncbi:MAG: hypothetical protein CMH95_03975 [Oceanospirillaceae bacterium]|nr:hypothetical protein [Oceanospirillaceae bacterium]OUX67399.1 MAG: hypothetical protein CBE36_00445 [Oceanospirillaceae bacterium TMED276]
MIVFDADLVKDWLGRFGQNTVRKLLGLSPKQGAQVASGDFSGFEELLMWAATNEPQDVSAELKAIEDATGLSSARSAILLGIPDKTYTRARKGDPVPAAMANYVRILAESPDLIERLKERTL